MNYKELAEKAREIKADGERFLAQYENEIVDFLREDAEDAEGSGSGQPGRDDAGRRYPAADDRSRGEAV